LVLGQISQKGEKKKKGVKDKRGGRIRGCSGQNLRGVSITTKKHGQANWVKPEHQNKQGGVWMPGIR